MAAKMTLFELFNRVESETLPGNADIRINGGNWHELTYVANKLITNGVYRALNRQIYIVAGINNEIDSVLPDDTVVDIRYV